MSEMKTWNSGMITMQSYKCGPYTFRCELPRIGTSEDKRQWVAAINGAELPARYPSLEDAMRAVLEKQQP